jgi:hypothetical protein
MVSSEADVLNKNVNKGSLEGAIKTIFGTKTDLVFLYMILYSIQWQASHGNWSCYANKHTSFE